MKKANGTMHFEVKADPLPISHSGGKRKYEWPFATMKVGECFYMPVDDESAVETTRARAVITRNALLHRVTGRRFVTRIIAGQKRIGCWRIA